MSRSNDGKQHRWGRSLQRLATFAILFLCSWTVSWAQGTTTGSNGKVTLKDATSPTIKLNSEATTTEKLSFTITETAEAQEGTHLETYYYIPGPDDDPEDENNPNRQKLIGSSQTVTVNWTPDDNIVVCTFTKRVDDSDHTNYDDSKLAWQIFHNTGSNELPCLDEPVITPGDQTVFAKEFTVTIDHDQWKEDLSIKPEIYYMIEERNDDGGTTITKDWTEATKLPLTLTLTKSSTVKAYALFGTDGTTTKEVSCTYILLDESTTYVNKEERLDVGTIVERNGMTMTYGGINQGYFTRFSNIDNSKDNILGSLHAVTGTPLYLNLDAMTEQSVVSEKGIIYNHKTASDQALHERTFSLPAIGSFFKFEPEANGKLTVFVEQQGAMLKSQGKLNPTKVRKRIVYFLDETGTSIPATYAYTSSKINKADWKSVQNSAVDKNDSYMTTLKAFYQSIINGNENFPNINSAFSNDSRLNGLVLGESIQPIIVLHDEANADILQGDNNYDKTGYMLISEGYVTYSFPVKAGKTYYLFASGTKLALSGFSFDQDATTPAEVTLDAKANNADKIKGMSEDQLYYVKLDNRTFHQGKWYTMVLPFSVSQKQMQDVFGKDVKILHYDNVESTNLNLFEHFYQMVVGGTPVLVKPSQDVVNPLFKNVTLTSKVVVDIVDENSGYMCTGSYDDVDFPEYSYFIDAKTNSFYQYDPTQMKPGSVKPHAGAFRAWFIASDPSTASQLTMHINGVEDSSETTAIWNALSADDNRTEMGSKDIYSLSGQKMNVSDMRSLPKGIYIVNGKKYIVK